MSQSALDIKDIHDNYGLLAVTRMSSSIEQAIIKPKLGYQPIMSQKEFKECIRFTFRDRADSLAQMSLNASYPLSSPTHSAVCCPCMHGVAA